MKVIDNDLGWKQIRKNYNKMNGRTIKAGVLEGAGNYAKGQSLANVATWNEYGTRRIPSRPFIAIATDEHKGWQSEVKSQMFVVMSPQGNVRDSLGEIGKQMKTDIRNVMGDKGKLTENAPATIARKGHDLPLIDTGKLRDAIDFEVK